MTPEQEMIERLEAVETCIIGQTFPDGTCENDRYLAGQAAAMIARLVAERDAAQTEVLEQARLLGMGAERELRLMAERDAAREELAQWVEVPRVGGNAN